MPTQSLLRSGSGRSLGSAVLSTRWAISKSKASFGVIPDDVSSFESAAVSAASFSSRPRVRRWPHNFLMAVMIFDLTTTPYIRWSSSDRGDPCKILICLKIVDFPDSPAPSSSNFTFNSSCCRARSKSRSIPLDLIVSLGSSFFLEGAGPSYGFLVPPALEELPGGGAAVDAPQPIVQFGGAMIRHFRCVLLFTKDWKK